jgi:hypothetical protein
MVESTDSPLAKELDRIAQIEERLRKIEDCLIAAFDRIEEVELQRVADRHNDGIDRLLDEYEQGNKPAIGLPR